MRTNFLTSTLFSSSHRLMEEGGGAWDLPRHPLMDRSSFLPRCSFVFACRLQHFVFTIKTANSYPALSLSLLRHKTTRERGGGGEKS